MTEGEKRGKERDEGKNNGRGRRRRTLPWQGNGKTKVGTRWTVKLRDANGEEEREGGKKEREDGEDGQRREPG